MGIKSFLAKPYAKWAIKQNQKWIKNPVETQEKVFKDLIETATDTVFGEIIIFLPSKHIRTLKSKCRFRITKVYVNM